MNAIQQFTVPKVNEELGCTMDVCEETTCYGQRQQLSAFSHLLALYLLILPVIQSADAICIPLNNTKTLQSCLFSSAITANMSKPESRIAIIGMACRLPGGANSPESLWSMLAEGRDGRKEVPRDRWDWKSFYNKNPDTKDAINFSHACFLDEDLSAFDARFFNISSVDAATIDPQQRLLLEVTYEALENAGLPIESLRGSNTSVHMGMFARDYDRMGYRDISQVNMAHIIGSGDAILANRISYVLDLKGSSNTLDTGCVSINSRSSPYSLSGSLLL